MKLDQGSPANRPRVWFSPPVERIESAVCFVNGTLERDQASARCEAKPSLALKRRLWI